MSVRHLPVRSQVRRPALVLLLAALALGIVGATSSDLRAGDDADPVKPPYANTPDELRPYQGLKDVYKRFFVEPPTFRGPGREEPEPGDVTEVPIGILLPRRGPDAPLGRSMERGIVLALEEANAAGGFRAGLPFSLRIREEALAWGAAAEAAVAMTTEDGVWGLIGGLEDANTHVINRVLLKLEVPLVNTSGPDPTLTEHMIPWLVRVRPDDRRSGYALAERIFRVDGHDRVAVLRSNDRYGRVGTREFVDAARRLRKPIRAEVRFETKTDDWSAQLDRLRRAQPDALVVWGRATATGRAVRAVREAGLDVPIYGPDRLVDPRFLEAAGAAAEGLVFTYPFHPERVGAAWTEFVLRFRVRFGVAPDATAGYAYDGARLLIESIRSAGLNRVRIREHLVGHTTYDGVTGPMRFDATFNNIAEVILGHVQDGTFHFD